MNRKKEMSNRVREPMADIHYAQWKSTIPILYDWFTNHNLKWPSLSCRWGPLLSRATQKNSQRLYYSEQTDGSVPNTLIIATTEVVKPRVAAAEHISEFDKDARSPFIKKHKTILHPGEVNRIRELPQNRYIVATHTDCPDVLKWNVKSQINRQNVAGAKPSCPDLRLIGHQDNADFALGMCPMGPWVVSGGKDKFVALWSIGDHISSLAIDQGVQQSSSSKAVAVSGRPGSGSIVNARGIFRGHEDNVEDVQFNPSSAQEFCSVGDDSFLIMWDARTGHSPVIKVENAHNCDIHCVDWNSHNTNLILTGSVDNTVRMHDRRNLISGGVASPIHIFKGHTAAVLCVQWCPDKSSVFGSAAEDHGLNIWDHAKIGNIDRSAGLGNSHPRGLFFKHAGHRGKVVDFHWNPVDPWTIVSLSDDGEKIGGGTLQIWRITEMITRPKEVMAELENLKLHAQECCP